LCAVSTSCNGSSRVSARVGRTRRGRDGSAGSLDSEMTTRSRAVSISTKPESGGNSSDTFGNSGIARANRLGVRLDHDVTAIGAAGSADTGISERSCL
jgi:hypothetical protein